MKTFFMALFVLSALCLNVGCSWRGEVETPTIKPIHDNTAQSISSSAIIQSDSIAKIGEANASSKQSVDSIRATTDESNKTAASIVEKTEDATIITSVDAIINHNQKIREDANAIEANSEKIQSNLELAQKQNVQIQKDAQAVQNLQQTIANLENEKQKLQNDAIKNLYTTLSFFFGLGFLTIISGLVLAFLVNKKLGMSIAGLGVLALALAAGAIYYLKAIAVVAIVIIIASIVVCLAIGVWHVVRENREKRTLEQANIENVTLVQKIKERLDPNAKVEIFGEYKPGLASTIQSDNTRDIVKKVRQKIDNNGETV
jgi:membrane protein implicated in regulation of membrane protease activity